MDYQLAKQLKDAGWPQNKSDTTRNWIDSPNEVASVVLPTLSELIEACHSARILLTEEKDGEWFSFSNTSVKANGKTPEEAVAKLWLELNKEKI